MPSFFETVFMCLLREIEHVDLTDPVCSMVGFLQASGSCRRREV